MINNTSEAGIKTDKRLNPLSFFSQVRFFVCFLRDFETFEDINEIKN